ncbi:MAG: hypothetical protein AAF645_22075, partial [Myxococcota bacterium]
MAAPSEPRLLRALAAVRRRIRLQRAINSGFAFFVVAFGVAAVALTLVKTGGLDESKARLAFVLAAALPFVGALIGALRPIRPLLAAQLLDRAHGLHSRIANALEFSEASERTAFMDAAIEDAAAHTDSLKPKAAMTLRLPQDWAVAIALAAGLAAVATLEVVEREAVALPPSLEPLLIDADSLEGFERTLDPVMRDEELDEDVLQVAQSLNSILEDMADRRLDRAEALRRIQQLETQLAEGRPADPEALDRSLEEVGRELERASIAEAASEALQEHDAETAADAVEELANELENDPPSARELDRLREALERAAREDEARQEEELQQEEEELESLLRQREESPPESQEEESLLRRQRRRLERLRRDRQELQEQRRRLERLRRDMRDTAEQLNRNARDPQQASESLRRMAEELNRMAREQMSEEQRERLQRQMQQLREMIRRARQQQQNGQGGQQGQQGQGQGQGQNRLRRFTLSANGQGDVRLQMPGQQGQG